MLVFERTFDFDNTNPDPLQNINDRKNTKVLLKVYNVFLKDVMILGFLSWLANKGHANVPSNKLYSLV